jgi:hypothetical protein
MKTPTILTSSFNSREKNLKTKNQKLKMVSGKKIKKKNQVNPLPSENG